MSSSSTLGSLPRSNSKGFIDLEAADNQESTEPPAEEVIDAPQDRLQKHWNRSTEEEILHELDIRRRERASLEPIRMQSAAPSKAILEDASRFLLRELLEKEITGRAGYKKGPSFETETDLVLFQKALDTSVLRIQQNPKPGYHSLPFYLHRESKFLDLSLANVLRKKEKGIVNKVCYNLLVSDAAPSLHTFNLLLRRFTKLRLTGLARTILATLFEVGFEPNAYTYAAILQYLIVTRNYDAFGKAVTVMRNSFLDYRNPVLASIELNGWSKFGDFMSMRRRLRLLQEEGLRNDTYVLTVELRYFAKRHMWEGGLPALKALVQKDVKDIDHRALFWAWKLCANCHQEDFIEHLKLVVQEKRWPVEMLWTRPARRRGLPYGYRGDETGQVQPPKPLEAPRWLGNDDGDDNDEDAAEELNLIPPTPHASPTIPTTWEEYSSTFKEDRIDGETIVMQNWTEAVLKKGDSEVAQGSRVATDSSGSLGSEVNTSAVSDGEILEGSDASLMANFKSHTQASRWRLLTQKRKQKLLESAKKP
ncbi:hypothetical protein ABW19_dt0207970 [Dactylella cylindrospora]|nr:hypothetical protein ABW19_dt0207970 [Dactylella cylindrospora]